jgi:lysophospholipase L1-like esterase
MAHLLLLHDPALWQAALAWAVVMRYLFRFICALALGVIPVAGCSDDGGTGGTGGTAGSRGMGFDVECVRSGSEPTLDAWDVIIEGYERSAAAFPPGPGQVVVTGSSNIFRWVTLVEDMSPVPALNRGFGGSVIAQVTHYADRIVFPYEPTAVILSAGTNDLNLGGSADCVFVDYDAFVEKIHASSPDLPIYFISVQPTPARWHLWEEMQRANQLIESRTQTGETQHFIDVTEGFLGENGEPIEALFVDDGKHMNEAGYAVWTSIIRPVLRDDLGY